MGRKTKGGGVIALDAVGGSEENGRVVREGDAREEGTGGR